MLFPKPLLELDLDFEVYFSEEKLALTEAFRTRHTLFLSAGKVYELLLQLVQGTIARRCAGWASPLGISAGNGYGLLRGLRERMIVMSSDAPLMGISAVAMIVRVVWLCVEDFWFLMDYSTETRIEKLGSCPASLDCYSLVQKSS